MAQNPFDNIELRLTNIERLLIDLPEMINPKIGRNLPPQDHEFLTLPEAASYLRLAEQTVYGLVHRKQIPHSKKHKRLYFTKQDLKDFIKGGKRKTVAENVAESEKKFIEVNK